MGNTLLVSLVLALTELAVIVIASPLARPSLVLRFLPEDIREAAKDHPEPPKWKQYTAHLLLVLFVLVWLGGFIVIGADGLKQGCGFGQLWLRYTVSLELIKLFDIVVQDQWLVMPKPVSRKAALRKKLPALIVFSVILAAIVWFVNGCRTFLSAFGTCMLIWTVVDWYDALVLDCLWFCHSKRVRVAGTEDMDQAYGSYAFHLKSSLVGMVLGLLVAVPVGVLVAIAGAVLI